MKITRPGKEEYAEYYDRYVSKVEGDNPVKGMENHGKKFLKFISKLNKKQLSYRYAEDKWTIKGILLHLMDAERVFCYRALRFARKDETELPGFDEKKWAPNSGAEERKIKSILSEYDAVRKNTLLLFSNMTDDMLISSGVANGNRISVRSLPYIILGHELHHLGVIKDRYLSKNGWKETENIEGRVMRNEGQKVKSEKQKVKGEKNEMKAKKQKMKVEKQNVNAEKQEVNKET